MSNREPPRNMDDNELVDTAYALLPGVPFPDRALEQLIQNSNPPPGLPANPSKALGNLRRLAADGTTISFGATWIRPTLEHIIMWGREDQLERANQPRAPSPRAQLPRAPRTQPSQDQLGRANQPRAPPSRAQPPGARPTQPYQKRARVAAKPAMGEQDQAHQQELHNAAEALERN